MPSKSPFEGTIKDLWRISLPLMISYLSLVTMLFADRIFLAKYSALSLNAAASAGTFAWAMVMAIVTLANMSEVFVAQYNGAGLFKKLGEPVWQMIWLSVMSLFFFLPLAFWGSKLIFGASSQEYLYFKWIMLTAPFSVLQGGLNGFFIGQGKAAIIKWLAVLGNAVNIILDPIFIFGLGPIPSMGIVGAAIATGIGVMIQALILFILFFKKKNQETYGTRDWNFKASLFYKALKIGMPPAIFVTLELSAWALFYWMMGTVSVEHIFVASVCQSILMLFLFFGFGIEKGAAAISGNLIGAKQFHLVKSVLKSGIILCLFFLLFIIFPFVFFPHFIIDWFLANPSLLDESSGFLGTSLPQIKSLVRTGLIFISLYIFFENLRWLLSGILTSAGDTLFLMISGTASVWIFMIVPCYYFVVMQHKSISFAFIIWVAYSIISLAFSLFRFYQGKWKDKHLIEEEVSSEEVVSSIDT